jgi:hypothetical protein
VWNFIENIRNTDKVRCLSVLDEEDVKLFRNCKIKHLNGRVLNINKEVACWKI